MSRFGFWHGAEGGRKTFREMVQSAAGLSNLQLCLDAADEASYPGSGQTWFDTSGNGVNFYLGTGSGAGADDPTFNGVAGQLTSSEYFSFDGGDLFQSVASHSLFNNIRSSGYAGSFAAVLQIPSSGGDFPVAFLRSTNSSSGALVWGCRSPGGVNADSGMPISPTINGGTLRMLYAQWIFIAGAYAVPVGIISSSVSASGHFMINSTISAQSITMAIDSPYSSATLRIGNSASVNLYSGSRIATLAYWDRQLSSAEMSALYVEAKKRFTSLP